MLAHPQVGVIVDVVVVIVISVMVIVASLGQQLSYFPNFQTCSKLSEMLAHPKVGVIVYIVIAIVVFMVSLNVL